jgi:hypothetical protein
MKKVYWRMPVMRERPERRVLSAAKLNAVFGHARRFRILQHLLSVNVIHLNLRRIYFSPQPIGLVTFF